jgi:hypothetical protein
MSTIQIFIPISQLAIIVGLSKYGSLTQIMIDFWIKIDKEGYQQRLQYLEKHHNKSLKLLSEKEKLIALSKEFGLDDLESKTKMAMKNSSKDDLNKDQNAIFHEINQNTQNMQNTQNLPIEEIESKKKILNKLVSNATNRGYGCYHENSAINIYAKITNSTITDQQKTIIALIKKTELHPGKLVEWYLKGKIDGLSSTTAQKTPILIEIKNRTKVLFGHLKDYEKPQIQSYLKLTGIKTGHLVEHLKSNDLDGSTNIIEVLFEEDYWKMLKQKLQKFIIFFIDFLKDETLQDLILLDGQYNEKVETHLRDLLHYKILL